MTDQNEEQLRRAGEAIAAYRRAFFPNKQADRIDRLLTLREHDTDEQPAAHRQHDRREDEMSEIPGRTYADLERYLLDTQREYGELRGDLRQIIAYAENAHENAVSGYSVLFGGNVTPWADLLDMARAALEKSESGRPE